MIKSSAEQKSNSAVAGKEYFTAPNVAVFSGTTALLRHCTAGRAYSSDV